MRDITISLPEELVEALSSEGRDLSRTALEALTVDAYRQKRISSSQLRRLLEFETPMELDAFLKTHGVELEYTLDDLERDRTTHRNLGL